MAFLLDYKEYNNLKDACTEEEVTEIEEKLGVKFPQSIREVYLILGKYYGFSFVDDNTYKFPDYKGMRDGVEEILSEYENGVVLNDNMFIVGCFMENGIFYFIKLDEGSNPPVYMYNEGDKTYTLCAATYSSFIQKTLLYYGYLRAKGRESGSL
ncbi:MAG TPA: SMI1/KNR4 family protein [Niastella sp.]